MRPRGVPTVLFRSGGEALLSRYLGETPPLLNPAFDLKSP